MKILYFHNENHNSKKANLIQVKSMCKAMGLLGLDVTLSLRGESEYGEIIDNNIYKLHFREKLYSNKRVDNYLNGKSVKKTIMSINPDLCYLRSPLLLRQVLTSGKPVIFELHNNKLHRRFNFLDFYWRRFLKNAVKEGNILKIVCISQELSNYWINEGIPTDKIITAHDGIDPDMFNLSLDQRDIKKNLCLPSDAKIVSYVGRLYENRHIGNILLLAESFPEAVFVIVGGPDDRSQYYKDKANNRNLENIIFTGQVSHHLVPNYLSASDVLLALWSSDVPTINYCSPLKIFEYMAAGKNIVAHGFPTIKEVLQHKKNSLLVEPKSLEDLISKTREALEYSYPSAIAERARKDVFKHYTWYQRAKTILEPFISDKTTLN